jgi:hypothetical protein
MTTTATTSSLLIFLGGVDAVPDPIALAVRPVQRSWLKSSGQDGDEVRLDKRPAVGRQGLGVPRRPRVRVGKHLDPLGIQRFALRRRILDEEIDLDDVLGPAG